MKTFLTELKAIDPVTGELRKYCGPDIKAISEGEATKWCRENSPYLRVIGELVMDIGCKKGTHEPDFNNIIDYEKPSLN